MISTRLQAADGTGLILRQANTQGLTMCLKKTICRRCTDGYVLSAEEDYHHIQHHAHALRNGR